MAQRSPMLRAQPFAYGLIIRARVDIVNRLDKVVKVPKRKPTP